MMLIPAVSSWILEVPLEMAGWWGGGVVGDWVGQISKGTGSDTRLGARLVASVFSDVPRASYGFSGGRILWSELEEYSLVLGKIASKIPFERPI
jgi:hypothetical protein